MSAIVEMSFVEGDLDLKLRTFRLDAAVAGELKAACDARWPARVGRLTVDLETVEFIDSSGIGALLSLYKRLPASHGAVHLRNATRPVRSVVQLLRLQQVFALD